MTKSIGDIKKLTDFMDNKDSIFKNATVLTEEYIPDKFLYREDEIHQIFFNISAFFHGIKPNNMLILGPPSSGKTHIMQAITDTLNEEAVRKDIKVKYIYVNVGNASLPGALSDTAREMGMIISKKLGLSIAGIIKRNMNGYKYCFVFDEFDRLKPTKEYRNPYDYLLNIFSRMGSGVCVVAIANNKNIMNRIEPPTKSSYSPIQMYFRAYNASEITEILKYRCNEAFESGIIDESVIERFSAWVYKTGLDLRTAFKVLLNAGYMIVDSKKTSITFEDLSTAFKRVEKDMLHDMLSKFNDTEILLIHSVATAQKYNSGMDVEKNIVYNVYTKICNEIGNVPLTWRHLNTYIFPNLELQGIIKKDVRGKGMGKGTATFFSLDGAEPDEITSITTEEINRRIR